MTRSSVCLLCFISILLALFAGQSYSQMPQFANGNLTTAPNPGSGHDYIRMLNETVNPANGSLSIRVEAPVPKQRGEVNFPYYVFGYDSGGATSPVAQVYCSVTPLGCQQTLQINWLDAVWPTANCGVAALGGGYVANGRNGQVCNVQVSLYTPNVEQPNISATCSYVTGYVYTDPYGGQHPLPGLQWITQNGASGGDVGCSFYGIGSTITSAADSSYQAVLYPDPSQVPGCQYQNCPLSPAYVTDSYGRGGVGISDTNGNSGFSAQPTIVNGRITSVAIPGLSNPYSFTYGSASRNYNPSGTLISSISSSQCGGWSSDVATKTVVTAVTLPNGQQYQFQYESTYGLIKKIIYPTGAWVSYTWAVNPTSESLGIGTGDGSIRCFYKHAWPYIQQRIVSFDGTNQALEEDFTYTTSWGTGNNAGQWAQKTTTVTTKDLLRPGIPSFQTVYTYSPISDFDAHTFMFTGQQAIDNQIVYEDFNGSTLRTVTKNWDPQTLPLLLSECTTLPNSGPTSGTFYAYSTLGVVSDKKEYDFGILASNACAQGSNPPTATPTRETVYTYQSFPNTPLFPGAASIFDRPSSVKIYDHGSSSPVGETDYVYDNYGTGGIASVPSDTVRHDETNFPPSYTNRGNVTKKTVKCFQTGCTDAASTFTYDETGQILTMADPCGNATCADMTGTSHTTTYNYADSWLSGDTYTSSVTPTGTSNTFLTKITYPPTNGVSHIENFSYDYPSGQLTVSKDQNGRQTTYRYDDAIARLTQANSPDGGRTTIAYSDSGPKPTATTTKTIDSSRSLTTVSTTDGVGHAIQSQVTTDPEGADTTDITVDGLGRAWTKTNPHRSSALSTDGTTTFTYDALGRATSLSQPDGSVVSTTYDQTSSNTGGTCTTVVDEAGKIRKSCSDALGRLIEVDEPGASATLGTPGTGTVTITGGPDQSGTFNMCPNTYPYNCPQFISDSGPINVIVNGFTASGGYGQGSTTQGIASAIASSLNSSSSPVTALLSGSTITMTSKAVGLGSNYSLSTSVNWNSQFFSQPSFNASTSGSTLTGGTDASVGPNPLVTLYSYDAVDNVNCAVQKGTDTTAFSTCGAAPATWRPRSFVYDSLSRLISATNPESGTITYTYDANGNVATKVAPIPNKIPADTSSPQTVTTTFTYDALNRVAKKTYSDGTPTVQYGYDGSSLSGCTYAVPTLSDTNPIGRRTSMCDGSGATHWALDITSGVGWKTTEARNIAGITKNIVSQDNFGGMLYQLTYPGGRIVTYTPNGSSGTAGRYASAVDVANGINYVQNAAYAPFGGLTSMSNGSAPITTTNAYNERLQPVTLSAATAANTLFSRSFDFHRANGDNGNVFQVVNNLDNLRSQSFTYDALNRIASAQSQATSGTKCWGDSYTIDTWGNLTSKAPTKCTAENLSAPATTKNQISGYCYDKAGNLLGTSACPSLPYTPTYTHDGENRLKAAGGVSYTYDGDGSRVKKSNGTLYWGTGPLSESDLSGNIQRSYVFFNGKRVARRDVSDGTVHYFYSDHLGSSSVVASATGMLPVEEDLDYFPYGGIAYGTQADHYLFTGKERDSESGLDNFGARYASSSLGRFMTPDWAGSPTTVPFAKFGDPQTLNLYSYVINNPLDRVDADGHCSKLFHWSERLCNEIDYGHFVRNQDLSNALQKEADLARKTLSQITGLEMNNGQTLGQWAAGASNKEVVDFERRVAHDLLRQSVADLLGVAGPLSALALSFPESNLQHEFSHAGDFGVKGNWNKQTGAEFQKALQDIVSGPNTKEYVIEFRGQSGFRAFLDQPSGKAVIFDQNGAFRAAWDLGADQVRGIVVNGKLW
jgi:RHS repeat-associated protein